MLGNRRANIILGVKMIVFANSLWLTGKKKGKPVFAKRTNWKNP